MNCNSYRHYSEPIRHRGKEPQTAAGAHFAAVAPRRLPRIDALLAERRTDDAARLMRSLRPGGDVELTPADRWWERVAALRDSDVYLHPNEREFLADMADRTDAGRVPTERQAAWLRKIERRARR